MHLWKINCNKVVTKYQLHRYTKFSKISIISVNAYAKLVLKTTFLNFLFTYDYV